MNDLEFSLAKLECQYGDTVVFKVRDLNLVLKESPESVVRFEAYLQSALPEGVKALLIDGDIEVSIVRKEAREIQYEGITDEDLGVG